MKKEDVYVVQGLIFVIAGMLLSKKFGVIAKIIQRIGLSSMFFGLITNAGINSSIPKTLPYTNPKNIAKIIQRIPLSDVTTSLHQTVSSTVP